MNIGITTLVMDVSVALQVMADYSAGKFKDAINGLQLIIDSEPKNWDAHLMLAACYFRTGQYSAAHRAFEFIEARACADDVRHKASEGLRVTTSKFERKANFTAEFGSHGTWHKPVEQTISWL